MALHCVACGEQLDGVTMLVLITGLYMFMLSCLCCGHLGYDEVKQDQRMS